MSETYMVQTNITAIKDQIEALSNEGKSIVIADNESYAFAGEFLKRIKQAQKQVDDTRKGMTRPIDEAKKKIMDLFRPVEERILTVEASIKQSLIQYQKVVDARIKAELEEKRKKDEAEAAERAKDAEFFGEEGVELEATKVEDQMQNVAPVVSGVTMKTVWTYEIVDETLLPREFLSVDEKKIRAGVEFGIRDVVGLRIFQKQIVSARR